MRKMVNQFPIFSFTLLAFTFSTNALPDGNNPPTDLQPQNQKSINLSIWTDPDYAVSYDTFFNPLICPHLDKIDWDKLNIELKFGPLAELNDKQTDGSLWCPQAENDCSGSLENLCIKQKIKNNKVMLDFYCCYIVDHSACPAATCAQTVGIEMTEETVKTCKNNQSTRDELLQNWQVDKPLFQDTTEFPASLINAVYYEATDAALKKKLFSTTCLLFEAKNAASYCPCDF